MSDNTERMLGQLDGKLDRLIENFDKYLAAHSERHKDIDVEIKAHAKDINQAKGAKNALILTAGAVSTVVAIIAAAADRIFK